MLKHTAACKTWRERLRHGVWWFPLTLDKTLKSELAVTVNNFCYFYLKNVIFIKKLYLALRNCVLLLCTCQHQTCEDISVQHGDQALCLHVLSGCYGGLWILFYLQELTACSLRLFIMPHAEKYPMPGFLGSLNNLYSLFYNQYFSYQICKLFRSVIVSELYNSW